MRQISCEQNYVLSGLVDRKALAPGQSKASIRGRVYSRSQSSEGRSVDRGMCLSGSQQRLGKSLSPEVSLNLFWKTSWLGIDCIDSGILEGKRGSRFGRKPSDPAARENWWPSRSDWALAKIYNIFWECFCLTARTLADWMRLPIYAHGTVSAAAKRPSPARNRGRRN